MDSSFAAKNKILKRMPGITYYPLHHVLRSCTLYHVLYVMYFISCTLYHVLISCTLYHVLRFSIKMNLSPVLVKLLMASFKTTNSFY